MDANYHPQTGFALLVSLIVVGVVLSVGLVILDLTIKQVRLAATTADSEVAFHAANAGMECARYLRREETWLEVSGSSVSANDVSVSCFGQSSETAAAAEITTGVSGGGAAYLYQYDFTWGSGDRCTIVDKVLIATPLGEAETVITEAEMQDRLPGYPGDDATCPAGSQCSFVTVRGYNQACPSAGGSFGFGVVERKVLLEF